MKVDIEILNRYVEKGWVEKNDHPTLPISIYNYSRNTQYEGKWDEITLMCRGLVLDKDGTVVAKAFNKFFNMEEHKPEEIPNGQFEVFEKLDGSLGILFNYNDEWILATKGSFTSDQAVKGMEILKKYKYDRLLKGYTYLFEIIYPENRIVCQYDFEDLILLAVIDNRDGYEIRIHDNEIHLEGIRLKNLYNNLGFKIVKKYDGVRDYSELKSKISQNEEGFVIKFGNEFRMKIKGEEYVRLHRILTGFSNVDIWEYLKDGRDLNEFLDRVPDEFDKWVKTTIKDLKTQYETLDNEYKWIFKVLMRSPQSETKKGFAELAKKYKHPSILFRMFDGKEYSDYIWKQIRPIYSKPFWQKQLNDE
jgi:phage anti-repressor protein